MPLNLYRFKSRMSQWLILDKPKMNYITDDIHSSKEKSYLNGSRQSLLGQPIGSWLHAPKILLLHLVSVQLLLRQIRISRDFSHLRLIACLSLCHLLRGHQLLGWRMRWLPGPMNGTILRRFSTQQQLRVHHFIRPIVLKHGALRKVGFYVVQTNDCHRVAGKQLVSNSLHFAAEL